MNKFHFSRIKKIQQFILQKKIDCFLILNPTNRYYLSGFELKDVQYNESAGFLIITSNDFFLFTDPRYIEEAKDIFSDNIFIYSGDKFKFIIDILKNRLNIKKIGFEYNFFNYEFFINLNKNFELIPFKNVVENLRKIKDEIEVEHIKKSNQLVYEVFKILPKYFKVGQTEKEIAWFIEKFFKEHGARENAFSPIVAFGKNAAKPHASPSDKKLSFNDVVLIDIGCRFLDYCSDQTRTFWFGDNPSSEFLKNLELVKEAQRKAIEFIKPGVKIKDAYLLVKDFFRKYGVDNYFTHALGHGIGLDTHEIPGINFTNEDLFETGMVITVEPGLYYPEWGGIRWEHMILVTKNGVEIL
ncbi:Xaa-Pro aminopeptidase [Desulfonauticus submarinus]|uniref:Xaa-Pro aminopeptidase n=1 Tax=Desulfonauticus submarinus TaxID=206665 RepID=A0A1H0DVM2_9BACT|nr:Xaa-Pro peptidase family protein [Desulfonauticus submarinus]SDN74200.1 Xaa-Pro aminopeptidase [Desulfonauticus submarinus]